MKDKQSSQKEHHNRHSCARELNIGQTVWACNLGDGPRWVRGVVSDRLGFVSYLIQLENGDLWRRHIDHLHAGSTVPSPETNAEDEGSLESVLFPQSPPVSETPTRTLSAPSDVPASIQPQTACSTASDLSTDSSSTPYPACNRRKPN